ncbi:hypothetical protein STAS_02328 [Striga asiatica]|uniref:Uncharacterized protein n=1 Tax=Striga asiatica TaxID=4170 RepID=A0A5A7P1H4_STRAF|nr:hypothetical protein STAS_02328 [Striga asiatica]
MEQNKKQILHGECPGKLDLNVPPLSTRRPLSNNMSTWPENSNSGNMVPFLWERIPGEPKDKDANDDIALPPPPKPPPGWRPPPLSDDDKKCSRNERFSDAIDIFSLAESTYDDHVEIGCKKATKDRSSDMPSFIIERFLPDAQALAEASVINNKFPFLSSPDYIYHTRDYFSRGSHSRHSPKGCGLGSIFPWRLKPKPCRVGSPVCDTIIGNNQRKSR